MLRLVAPRCKCVAPDFLNFSWLPQKPILSRNSSLSGRTQKICGLSAWLREQKDGLLRIFYNLKYIPYTHSTCRIYSLLVPGILESRMSQETASYWQSPSSREKPEDHYLDPDTFAAQTARRDGSWWPEWAAWLDARSGAPVPPPR